MNHFKRVFALLVCICLMAAALAGCGGSSSTTTASDPSNPSSTSAPAETTGIDYPTKDIQGSIMWSAGGVCDMSARAIGAVAQDALGANIIFTCLLYTSPSPRD